MQSNNIWRWSVDWPGKDADLADDFVWRFWTGGQAYRVIDPKATLLFRPIR
jgi:hypothetical protein